MEVRLFDSHAHVDDKRFDEDRDAVITRARDNGVACLLNVGADMPSSARSVELARRYAGVYAAVGVHPHDAKDCRDIDYVQLAEWTHCDKVVAIGEIGLDYHYDHSPRDVQREVFVRHMDVARQCHKPVIIHDREAHGDVLAVLRQEAKGLTGVLHCFSGSWEMAEEVLALGFYISFAGPVTYKNSPKLQEIARQAPLDRILVETDCPYLTPVPHRGQRNEPAHVRLTAQYVAGLRQMELAEFAAAATENTCRLFGIDKQL